MILILCVCIISYILPCIKCALEAKIVGGAYAEIENFPHAAFLSIQCELKSDGKLSGWICGSSILNQNLLLTAAHCVEGCSPKSWISVSVGHAHIKKGSQSSVSSFVVHEEYYSDTTMNDIGLVKVKTPLLLNPNVQRVVLLEKPPYCEMALVAGWGVIDVEGHKIGSNLKAIEQRVWKKKDCIALLNSIPQGTFCASSTNNSDYASGGDSGNGLMVRGYIQIGLVSYKKPGKSQSVIVYTDVGFFYKWITKTAERIWCESNLKNLVIIENRKR